MGRADVYSQPDAPDPVLSDAVVRELARTHLPVDLPAHMHVQVDESGGEAAPTGSRAEPSTAGSPVGTWAAAVSWSRLSGRTGCPLDKPGWLHAQTAGFAPDEPARAGGRARRRHRPDRCRQVQHPVADRRPALTLEQAHQARRHQPRGTGRPPVTGPPGVRPADPHPVPP
jgi:hypothetical protein